MTYHYIPEAQKQLVLRMSLRGMKEKDISVGKDKLERQRQLNG